MGKKKKIKKSVSVKNSLNKKVSKKDFEAFEFGVQRLKQLEKELNSLNTRGFSKEESLIRSKLKTVSAIPEIEKELKNLKAKIKGKYKPKKHKSKISKINKDLKEIKEYADDVPKIRKEIKNLGERIENINKNKRVKGKVDSKVGMLVDTDFNGFLTDIKVALSKRINDKERELDNVLNSDLKKREMKYKQKNQNLIKEFNDHKEKLDEKYQKKYETKVNTELHKEISDKFNKKLREEIEKHKIALGKRYKKELKSHADEEFKKRIRKIIKQYDKKFLKKLEKLKKKEEKEHLDIEKQKNKVQEDVKKTEKQIEREKKQLENKKILFSNEKEKEIKKIKNNLIEKNHDFLLKQLGKKERALREELSREYELKLKKKIQEHEQEIKKKKIELELEMQKKIKQAFK